MVKNLRYQHGNDIGFNFGHRQLFISHQNASKGNNQINIYIVQLFVYVSSNFLFVLLDVSDRILNVNHIKWFQYLGWIVEPTDSIFHRDTFLLTDTNKGNKIIITDNNFFKLFLYQFIFQVMFINFVQVQMNMLRSG